MKDKTVCSAVFLDIAQASDRVWHSSLTHKLNSILPETYVQILKSYSKDRKFRTKVGGVHSEMKNTKAGGRRVRFLQLPILQYRLQKWLLMYSGMSHVYSRYKVDPQRSDINYM